MNIDSPAVIFLLCVAVLLIFIILLFLYVKQIACCAKLPKPLCLSDMPRAGNLDESDEELFDKYEDLMNNCTSSKDNLACVDNVEIKIAPIYGTPDSVDAIEATTEPSHPSIQIALSYKATSGMLEGRIVKGCYLQLEGCKNDVYVKVTLCSDAGFQLGHMDTKKISNELHPSFGDCFKFEVPLYQIRSVTMVISAYNKISLKSKQMVGWIGIGCFNSSPDQLNHWLEVIKKGRGIEIIRWHKLLDPSFLHEETLN